MRAPLTPVALLAAVAALAVLTAGCLGQDRQHHPTFTVVADVESAVVPAGQTEHLSWSQAEALEVEGGEHLEEGAEIDWAASTGAHGVGENFSLATGAPGLILVEVDVTAAN